MSQKDSSIDTSDSERYESIIIQPTPMQYVK